MRQPIPRPPRRALQHLDDTGIERLVHGALRQAPVKQPDKRPILCAFCRHAVSSAAHKIDIGGQHTHVFTNPYGIRYELGCFAEAGGCVQRGIPTLEYTWFPGHAWRLALCAECDSHLGWFYQSQQASFYGLILAHILEGPS